MINRMLLKSEAVCMQPVPMETLTPTKYESSAFYHFLSTFGDHAIANESRT